jgi:hypothetical protein
VNPLTHVAAVTNEKDGTIVLIDYTFPALPAVVGTIALPHSKNPKDPNNGPRAQPRGVAFDYGPSTNRLAVADPGSGLLVIVTLDSSNHAVGFATLDPTPNKPDKAVAVAVNPGFDYGIVTTGGDNGTGSTVYAFTLSQPALIGMVPRSKGEPKKPGGVAIDPVTCRAVVTAQSIDGISKANLLLLQTPCAPVITVLTPPAARTATTFLLTVAGTGFNITQTTLNFGDVTGIPMTQVAPGVMGATVTAPATVGSINVSVTSNGKTSNSLPFQVTLLIPPVLCSVTPTTSVADQNPLPLQIGASNVTTTGATAYFGGQPITLNSITPVVPPPTDATGCVTAQIVSATVPGYPTTTLTTHASLPSPQVQIKNSDGGSSNLLTVVISNPVPLISQLVPSAAAVGSADLTILIFGDDFVYDVVDGDIVMLSQVRFNGTPLVQVLPYGPSPRTQMQVVVPAELMQTVQTYVVDVFNPAPGGGALALTQQFQVTDNAPPPGITVTTVCMGEIVDGACTGNTPTTVALLTGLPTLTGIAAISDTGDLRSIDMPTSQLVGTPVPVAGPGAIGFLRALPGGKAVITTLIDSDQLAVIDYSGPSPVVTTVDLNALAGSPCPPSTPCLYPSALAVDAAGNVVVTNYGTATLQVLSATNSGSGWTVTSAGPPIDVPGLVAPVGVAVDTSNGVAVIIDSPDPDPGVVWRVGYKSPATYGAVSAPIQLPLSSTGPSGIAVNSTTHEAVVGATGDNTIHVVTLPGSGGIRASLASGVNPSGVAVDSGSNRALVANINNNEITGINLNPSVPSVTRFQLSFAAQNPSDIAWDPASGRVLAGTLIGQTNYAIVIGGLTPSQLP